MVLNLTLSGVETNLSIMPPITGAARTLPLFSRIENADQRRLVTGWRHAQQLAVEFSDYVTVWRLPSTKRDRWPLLRK